MDTILAIDDTKENLDILLDMLDEFDVIPVTNGFKALEIINSEPISLILLDIVMPEMDGFEVCKILKSNPKTADIPIIFTTAKTDETSIAKAYDAGGNDYVSKPLKRAEVVARVKTQLHLKKTLFELEFIASHDSMTEVYNRRKFFELGQLFFGQKKETLFVSMLDIDNFKKVNDTFGHDAGDIVIKLFAKTVKNLLPEDAIFGRIGGEEFAVMLEHNDKESVYTLFETIKHAVANLCINHNNENISFTVSNGIAQKKEGVRTLDELLKQADIALYDAKEHGRNCVILR